MDLFASDLSLADLSSSRFREASIVTEGWTFARVDRLIQLYNEGWSYAYIACELGGTSRNAVAGKVQRLGLPPRVRLPSRPMPRRRKPRTRAARAKTIMAELPLEPIKQKEFLGLTLFELTADTCRFPRGEGPNYLFCGQPTIENSSYCEFCHSLTHTPITPAQISQGKQREKMRKRLSEETRRAK